MRLVNWNIFSVLIYFVFVVSVLLFVDIHIHATASVYDEKHILRLHKVTSFAIIALDAPSCVAIVNSLVCLFCNVRCFFHSCMLLHSVR